MGVDPSGHNREAPQVIAGLGGAAPNGHDASAFDDDLLVVKRAADSIENGACLDHDVILSRGECRKNKERDRTHESDCMRDQTVAARVCSVPGSVATIG